jgi:hypothetical protein
MRAYLLAGLAGMVILALVQYAALPALMRNLTAAQVAWLRSAFVTRTGWILFAIVILAALRGLPELFAAVWAVRRGQSRDRLRR